MQMHGPGAEQAKQSDQNEINSNDKIQKSWHHEDQDARDERHDRTDT